MRTFAAILAVTAVVLTGCGGDGKKTDAKQSADTTVPVTTAAATTSPTAASSAAGSPADTSAPATSAPATVDASAVVGGVDGKATCEFLRATLPKLKAAGSPVGALAQLAIGYATFVEQQPGAKVPDAATLDAITTKDCPDVRADVLKVLEAKSFAGNL